MIFRATEQWFIETARIRDKRLRQNALAEIDKVKWLPAWGRERMHDMIAERPDWCISRQRFWGVPLIVFYCDACGKQLKDYAALRHVLPFFEREGADAWYTHSAEELLPPGTKCSCGARNGARKRDILDVWFDSGSTHLAVLTRNGRQRWPADVYLEGPDQYRGWFQSSLLVAMGMRGTRAVSRGGDARLDARRKRRADVQIARQRHLSRRKSATKWGADLLRVWVVSQDYTADVRISEAMMTQLAEAYRKIRNTFRFALIESFRFRSGARFRGRCRAVGNRRVDAAAHRRSRRASAASGTTISNFIASIMRCTISAPWTSARFISTC